MAVTKKCTRCKKVKKTTDFVNNEWSSDSKDFWCKKCRTEICVDEKTLREYSKANSRPFSSELWEAGVKATQDRLYERLKYEGHDLDEITEIIFKKAVGYYLSKLHLRRAYDLEPVETDKIDTSNIPREYILQWGTGYSLDDYERLERFYIDMTRDYRIETSAHKDYLKIICKVSLNMHKAIDGKSIAEFEKLSKQYDNLMKSAKFTAVQRSASDETGGLNTFSDFFRLIEEEGFIPTYPKEINDVVDKTISYMEDYLKKLFLNDPQIMQDIEMATMSDSEEEEDLEQNADLDSDDDDISEPDK